MSAEYLLNGNRKLNLHEIAKHKTEGDLWIILYDKVYDITSILEKHPGGAAIILKYITKSQDLTKAFEQMQHSSKARYTVSAFCIGSFKNKNKNKNNNNNNGKTLFSKIEALKPSPSDLSQNIWDYTPSKSAEMEVTKTFGSKKIIGWGDLFSVKIEMLDNQHESLIDLMNKMYNFGNITDLNEFIVVWNIHCETEQYLFEVYNFEHYKRKVHMADHTRITNILNDLYEKLSIKYDDKLNIDDKKMDDVNTEPFQCQELSNFMEITMVSGFKKHAFEYDSLYIDKFGETDPSIYVKWEKSSTFDLMKPIFPDEDRINLAIFQDTVYGNNQLMLQLQNQQ